MSDAAGGLQMGSCEKFNAVADNGQRIVVQFSLRIEFLSMQNLKELLFARIVTNYIENLRLTSFVKLNE
jgi:hypothetical protein